MTSPGAVPVPVELHPHARERMEERGTTEQEVVQTVREGERFAGKFGRSGFRRNFAFSGTWRGRPHRTKQVEVLAVEEGGGWLVITVITRYY